MKQLTLLLALLALVACADNKSSKTKVDPIRETEVVTVVQPYDDSALQAQMAALQTDVNALKKHLRLISDTGDELTNVSVLSLANYVSPSFFTVYVQTQSNISAYAPYSVYTQAQIDLEVITAGAAYGTTDCTELPIATFNPTNLPQQISLDGQLYNVNTSLLNIADYAQIQSMQLGPSGCLQAASVVVNAGNVEYYDASSNIIAVVPENSLSAFLTPVTTHICGLSGQCTLVYQ